MQEAHSFQHACACVPRLRSAVAVCLVGGWWPHGALDYDREGPHASVMARFPARVVASRGTWAAATAPPRVATTWRVHRLPAPKILL